jgi:hypothetical protein
MPRATVKDTITNMTLMTDQTTWEVVIGALEHGQTFSTTYAHRNEKLGVGIEP